MKEKVLNLYAGIGGNRKLWEDVDVTAVEIEPNIAMIYQHFFPNDKVVVGDAHQYLLDHYKEFDFIWSSPPCPTHSGIRKELAVELREQNAALYPDMQLYEEILFLQGYLKCDWIVENVISWYEPLVKPHVVDNHFLWSNYYIPPVEKTSRNHHGTIMELELRKGFDLSLFKGIDKRKILRNCVEPELGLHVFKSRKRQQRLDV